MFSPNPEKNMSQIRAIVYVKHWRVHLVCGRFGVLISDRPNLTQRCKQFPTAYNIYASSCVASALWCGDGHANSLHASA